MAIGRVGVDTYELSRLDILQRDKAANGHPNDFGSYLVLRERPNRGLDGLLTAQELRDVRDAQRNEMLEGDSFARNRYEESNRLLDNMRRDRVEAVNYLPRPLEGIGLNENGDIVDLRIRMRAAELVDAAYALGRGGGEITQAVVDFVADKYWRKWRDHDIVRNSLNGVYDEIDTIIDAIKREDPAIELHKPIRPE